MSRFLRSLIAQLGNLGIRLPFLDADHSSDSRSYKIPGLKEMIHILQKNYAHVVQTAQEKIKNVGIGHEGLFELFRPCFSSTRTGWNFFLFPSTS
jgi:hypothetical protein